MKKRSCWRAPLIVDHIDSNNNKNFNRGVLGVSIVTEFLNIWEDIRKYYGDTHHHTIQTRVGQDHSPWRGFVSEKNYKRKKQMIHHKRKGRNAGAVVAVESVIIQKETNVAATGGEELAPVVPTVISPVIEVDATNNSYCGAVLGTMNYKEVGEEALGTSNFKEVGGEALGISNQNEVCGEAVAINKTSVLAGVSFPFSDFMALILESKGGEETKAEVVSSLETDQYTIEKKLKKPVHYTRYSKRRKKKRSSPPMTNIVEEDSAIISVAEGFNNTRTDDISIVTSDSNPPGTVSRVSADFNVSQILNEADNYEQLASMTKICDVKGLEEDCKNVLAGGDLPNTLVYTAEDLGEKWEYFEETISNASAHVEELEILKVNVFEGRDGLAFDNSDMTEISNEFFHHPPNEILDVNNNSSKFSPNLPTIIDADEDDTADEEYQDYHDDVTGDGNYAPSSGLECLNMKHPLQHDWTFWYFYPDKRMSWEENLKQVQTVSTIEDFWAVQNWIEPVSSLKSGADYSLFKAGICPDWEDSANSRGGRWIVRCKREEVDKAWMEVIMAMVGQQFGENQDTEINGGVVSNRVRGDKVAVWVRSVEMKGEVGSVVTDMLGRTGVFKVHQKEMNK